ncbi:acyltransferase [Klebsiella pneumoniae]
MYILAALFSLIVSFFILRGLNYQKGIYNSSGVESISGLRAFLALAVLLSHSTHYLYSLEKKWIYDANYKEFFGIGNIYLNLGKVGVLMFFMISGFLFYRLVYKESMNTRMFLKKRILRIVPAYWFSMIVIITIGCFYYKVDYNIPSLIQLLRWAFFIGDYSIGGINTAHINAGVDWTLKIEWILYLSLPALFVLTRKKSKKYKDISILISILIIMILAFIIRFYAGIYTDPRPVLGFASGLLAFRLSEKTKALKDSKPLGYIAAFFVVLSLPLGTYAVFYLSAVLLCTFSFLIVSSGNTIGDILSNKTIVSLGEASYSIYLIYGIVLFLMEKVDIVKQINTFSGVFLFDLVLIIITAYASKLLHLKVERRWFNKDLSMPKES